MKTIQYSSLRNKPLKTSVNRSETIYEAMFVGLIVVMVVGVLYV